MEAPVKKIRRWISSPILYQCETDQECPTFVVQIIDEDYNELYHEVLTTKERKMFSEIISDPMYAILYKQHPKLRTIAFMKLDKETLIREC